MLALVPQMPCRVENKHDNGIGNQLFFAGPRNLFQLIIHVLEGLGDPLGQILEPAEDLAQLALSGFLYGLFSFFSRFLNLRHFFHILTALIGCWITWSRDESCASCRRGNTS